MPARQPTDPNVIDVELAWAAVSCPRCTNAATWAPHPCPAEPANHCHCCADCTAICATVAAARGAP